MCAAAGEVLYRKQCQGDKRGRWFNERWVDRELNYEHSQKRRSIKRSRERKREKKGVVCIQVFDVLCILIEAVNGSKQRMNHPKRQTNNCQPQKDGVKVFYREMEEWTRSPEGGSAFER